MKFIIKQKIRCLVMVLCSCLLSLTAYAERVQIVTFHYPPFMDSNNPNGGLMEEIVKSAFHEVHIEIDFVYYPANRMLHNFIGTEKVLGCIGPVALIDRQSEIKKQQTIRVPSLVNIIMVLVYYKPTHSKKPTTYGQLTDLNGYRVGTIRGSNTIQLLQKAGIDVSEASIESQIKMLKTNRIDFAVVGFLTGTSLIKKLYPGHENEFAFISKPIMELPTSIYFNKGFPNSDEYAEQFNTGLSAIIKNGQYIQILEKYYKESGIPFEYKPIFHTLGIQYSF